MAILILFLWIVDIYIFEARSNPVRLAKPFIPKLIVWFERLVVSVDALKIDTSYQVCFDFTSWPNQFTNTPNYIIVKPWNLIQPFLLQTAKKAGWLPTNVNAYPRANHVGFGLVCGEDKKRFRTRSTQVVRLVDLLEEAKTRCKDALIQRGIVTMYTYLGLLCISFILLS